MATGEARAHEITGADMASRVATKVKDALRGEARLKGAAATLSARIAGATAAAVAELPVEARRNLSRHEPELMTRIRGLVETLSGETFAEKIELDDPISVEPRKGAGLGTLLSDEEADEALYDLAVARKLEDWAGPVAGPTELDRDYGISRSTLHRWHQESAVVALLKGTRKHVYPVDQFIDGRPAKGLAEINAIIPDPRVAWAWLSRPNPVLGGRKPIDLLKRNRVTEVVDVVRDHFGQP